MEMRRRAIAAVALAACAGDLNGGGAEAGDMLYVTSSHAGVVSVVDPGSRGVVAEIDALGDVFAIAASPAGNEVYVTTETGLVVIDTRTNRVAATVALEVEPTAVAVSFDGELLYVATRWFLFYVVETRTRAVREVAFDAPTTGILPSPDGASLYVLHEPRASSPGSSFSVVDAATFEIVREVPFLGVPVLAVEPRRGDLLTLGITATGGDLVFLRARTGTVLRRLGLGVGYGATAFAPGGEAIVIWGESSLALLDAETGAVSSSIAAAGQRDVAVSPTGLVYSLSSVFSAVLVFDPSAADAASPLVAAIPVPVQVERMALADVPEPSAGDGGGCAAAPGGMPVTPWLAAGALLLGLHRVRLRSWARRRLQWRGPCANTGRLSPRPCRASARSTNCAPRSTPSTPSCWLC